MKVLFVKPSDSTFVRIDQEILQRHFHIKIIQLKGPKNKIKFFFDLFRMGFFLIFRSKNYDLFFTRFADYHSAVMVFLGRILRKKTVVVIGGYDVYHIPEFSYGAHHKKIRSRCSKYVLNRAHLLLPNSKALIYSENTYALGHSLYAGIHYYAPRTKSKIELVYNGFDSQKWKPSPIKEKMVVSVAFMDDLVTYAMKGMDDFIQVARNMPSVPFVFIGATEDFKAKFLRDIPQNLYIQPPLLSKELVDWYGKAKVFCILSLSEGMPNALCEAMLSGCIPVGSNVDPIPEIIGDTGFIIKEKKAETIILALKMALEASDDLCLQARERVIQEYSLQKREITLVNAIKNI